MSLSSIPLNSKMQIVSYFYPEKIKTDTLKEYGRRFVEISLTNKDLNTICHPQLEKLKKIYELALRYNREAHLLHHMDLGEAVETSDDAQLLLYACNAPFFTKELTEDIKAIIDLFPQSLNYQHQNYSHGFVGGRDRFRQAFTPLYVACWNSRLPTSIVELLLIGGAEPKAYLEYNNQSSSIQEELEIQLITSQDAELINRLDVILKLFKQYSKK